MITQSIKITLKKLQLRALSHRWVGLVLVLGWIMLYPFSKQGGSQEQAFSQTTAALFNTSRRLQELLFIDLNLNATCAPDTSPNQTAYQALSLALLENGLASLPNVVPTVVGAVDSLTPGLKSANFRDHQRWVGDLQVILAAAPREELEFGVSPQAALPKESERLYLQWRLCERSSRPTCYTYTTSTKAETPEVAIAEIWQFTSKLWAREVTTAQLKTWQKLISPERYALLACGKAAALWYNLTVPALNLNSNSLTLASFKRLLQRPNQLSLAAWFSGRYHFAKQNYEAATLFFAEAVRAAPKNLVYHADLAASLAAQGAVKTSLQEWRKLTKALPEDWRFLPAKAASAIHGGAFKEATVILTQTLPAYLQADPQVLRLEADLLEKVSVTQDLEAYDALLSKWQIAEPQLAEPLRRRIAWRIRQGLYAEAQLLTQELAHYPEAAVEAQQKQMALALALKDWQGAIAQADALKQPLLARRIRLRAALEADPMSVPGELAKKKTLGLKERLALSEVYLNEDKLLEANQELDQILQQDPWQPLALTFKIQVLRKQHREVESWLLRLRKIDPLAYEYLAAETSSPPNYCVAKGASTSPGKTLLGMQVHSRVAP